jgi:hypothetical protein
MVSLQRISLNPNRISRCVPLALPLSRAIHYAIVFADFKTFLRNSGRISTRLFEIIDIK